MENKLNYESVPTGYAHCFNDQCVRNQECLRHTAALQCNSLNSTIRIINPFCIPEDTFSCSYYHSAKKIRIAWGIKHLFDKVPHKDAIGLKSDIMAYLGRTRYYRIYRKEVGLSPADQQFIRQVFQHKGIAEEPAFDSYTLEYKWD